MNKRIGQTPCQRASAPCTPGVPYHQLERLQHRPGTVAHAQLGQGERALLASHWLARAQTHGALRRAGHPVAQTSCSSNAFSTA
ncbi:hypothetical protein QY701_12355, partial [Xanthomonas campestris]|uniref:hypothetical protein n=1 Tax=Xanthomonas campestris TaxID=339 RepID=UPI002B22395C